jgi:2-(1,2-epoxy-1,2-dihydrophenyl)acetyl-CoA isomerase
MSERYSARPGLNCALVDGVLRLEFDRVEKRNALTDDIVAGVIDSLVLASTDESVRVVVMSGVGDHFCSGFDIVTRNEPSGSRPRVGSIQRRLPSQANRLISLMLRTQVPIVCVVRGWSAGIGLSLALAADFTIASHDAKFWAPFLGRGFTPDSGITWMLPRRIGEVRAREMLLLGRAVSGLEAADWSMVHSSVDLEELDQAAATLVDALSSAPTVAFGLTKSLLAASSNSSLESQFQDEAFSLELSSRSEDFKEGLRAFTEKRDPTFKGR